MRNLRQSLYRLRGALDAAAPGLGEELLTQDRQTVTLHSRALVTDVGRFWQEISLPAQHQHRSLAECPTCRDAVD